MKNSNAIIKTLLILGVIYCLLAYWLPVREYRRVTDRFNQYIAETFMSESNSNGTYLVARLEMSPDEFCSLKEELVVVRLRTSFFAKKRKKLLTLPQKSATMRTIQQNKA